jgi:hypothetical protein
MNRLEKINNILDGSSTRLRESYFINNYDELYNDIVNFTNINDISFKERLWYWVNDIKDEFLCKCGKKTTFNKNWLDGYRKWCSPKCAQTDKSTKEKRKKTVQKKYGVDNIAKLEETKRKQESTNLERYGTKSSFQNKDVQKKWKDKVKNKWGVEHVFQLKSIKEKSKKTSLDKWGTEHFVQSNDYKERLEEIGFSDKLRAINLNKHIEKYGELGLEFIELNDRVLTLRGNCDHEFTIHYDSLKRRIENGYEYCTICNPVNTGQSQEEKLIIEWLKSLDLDIIEKDRSLGIELDIFIPSKSIAIEFNGLYWHSELYKNNDYHLKKSNICLENGIRLIHIWEDDWLYKRDIMKSIILNSLGLIKNKIYSRNCNIITIDSKQKDKFLEENHIQGKCTSSLNLALEYRGEIVSLMTFGKRRLNNKSEFELIRFCNKVNHIVVGSASKLFKHFIKNNEFNSITSFADLSHFNGDLYKNLGFDYIHRTASNYWWVVDGVRHHRFTYNKKRLIKEGADPNKTGVEIMYNKGYFRIFGCGQDKYIFNLIYT